MKEYKFENEFLNSAFCVFRAVKKRYVIKKGMVVKMGRCTFCNFGYIFKPEKNCVNCGYYFDYINKYSKMSISALKSLPEKVYIRTGLCAICEKGETKKGLHAYVKLTNKGVEIEVFEKFQYGPFVNKKWTFNQNPRLSIPYNELTIKSGDYDGKKVDYYVYSSPVYGDLRLNFNADATISSKYHLNSEMKKLCEDFIAAY